MVGHLCRRHRIGFPHDRKGLLENIRMDNCSPYYGSIQPNQHSNRKRLLVRRQGSFLAGRETCSRSIRRSLQFKHAYQATFQVEKLRGSNAGDRKLHNACSSTLGIDSDDLRIQRAVQVHQPLSFLGFSAILQSSLYLEHHRHVWSLLFLLPNQTQSHHCPLRSLELKCSSHCRVPYPPILQHSRVLLPQLHHLCFRSPRRRKRVCGGRKGSQ